MPKSLPGGERGRREGPKAQGRGQDCEAPKVQVAVVGQARPLDQWAKGRDVASGREARVGWCLKVRHVEGKRPRMKDVGVQVERGRRRRGSGGGEEVWKVEVWPCP